MKAIVNEGWERAWGPKDNNKEEMKKSMKINFRLQKEITYVVMRGVALASYVARLHPSFYFAQQSWWI